MKGSFRDVRDNQERGFRRQYIENSLGLMYQELDDPAIIEALGSVATRLSELLEDALPVDIVRGVIQLPEGLFYDRGIAVAAIRPDEEIELGEGFFMQTESQRTNTLETLNGWEPKESAESFYERNIHNIHDQFGWKGAVLLGTVTTVANRGIFSERKLDNDFHRPPDNAIAIIQYRPALVLMMEPGTEYANPDVVAHGLVHSQKMGEYPLVDVESQPSFDSLSIREELEAYHVGATIGQTRINAGAAAVRAWETNDETYTQIIADSYRQELNPDPADPYRPSAELTAAVLDLTDEPHTRFDYTRTVRAIRENEVDTDH